MNPKESVLIVKVATRFIDFGLDRKTSQWHHRRMREHIARPSEQTVDLPAGAIEADESYFGSVPKGKRGPGAAGKVRYLGG
jgi:hypothetical protein